MVEVAFWGHRNVDGFMVQLVTYRPTACRTYMYFDMSDPTPSLCDAEQIVDAVIWAPVRDGVIRIIQPFDAAQ